MSEIEIWLDRLEMDDKIASYEKIGREKYGVMLGDEHRPGVLQHDSYNRSEGAEFDYIITPRTRVARYH